MHDLYNRFHDEVAFFIVYIKEAHPEDGWVVTTNREDGIKVADPQSAEERSGVATACVVNSSIHIPMLIDDLDNTVASAYGGWPDRLYLIGRDGRIAFQGDQGPFGFIPDQLEHALIEELSKRQ